MKWGWLFTNASLVKQSESTSCEINFRRMQDSPRPSLILHFCICVIYFLTNLGEMTKVDLINENIDEDRVKTISGEIVRPLNLEMNLIWARSLQSALETDYGDNFAESLLISFQFTTTWWEIRWIFDSHVSGDKDRRPKTPDGNLHPSRNFASTFCSL